jgi:hypothetical protein
MTRLWDVLWPPTLQLTLLLLLLILLLLVLRHGNVCRLPRCWAFYTIPLFMLLLLLFRMCPQQHTIYALLHLLPLLLLLYARGHPLLGFLYERSKAVVDTSSIHSNIIPTTSGSSSSYAAARTNCSCCCSCQ